MRHNKEERRLFNFKIGKWQISLWNSFGFSYWYSPEMGVWSLDVGFVRFLRSLI